MTNGCIAARCAMTFSKRCAVSRRMAGSTTSSIDRHFRAAARGGNFKLRTEEGESLEDVSRLDTIVAVVNARTSCATRSIDFLKDRGEALGEEDTRRWSTCSSIKSSSPMSSF